MERRPDLVLANVRLPGGKTADVSIREGRVVHQGASGAADRRIDCAGIYVLPAAVDVHVHMRGGSQSEKEDWKTGTASAIAGGVTVVVDQPNTVPPLTTPETFRDRVREAREHSLCNFSINSGVTSKTSLEAMWAEGAMAFGEIFFAPSSYGEALGKQDLGIALRRIRALGGLATIHAEGVRKGEDTSLATHDALRSPQQELEAVHAVQNANTDSCRLHFCHLSTVAALEAVRGTAEVTPHHLFLSRENSNDTNTRFKVNPPVRSERERKNLLAAWNRIDIIASDHAPHTRQEKGLPFSQAPSGVPGVETMVPLLMSQMLEKKIPLEDIIRKTAIAPATLIGIPPAGFSPGDRADFALYPPSPEKIIPERLHSKCGWTPFEGFRAVFPETVIMGGSVVYRNGEFSQGAPSWYTGKGYLPQGL